MLGGRKIGKICNFVHNDEIWKDHVNYEFHSLRKWPEKWGFLTHEYNRMHRRLIGESPSPELPSLRKSKTVLEKEKHGLQGDKVDGQGIKLPSLKRPKSRTSTEKQRKRDVHKTTGVEGHRWAAAGFPRTTAEEIGWKSAKPVCQLEMYGRYLSPNARGQQGIRKMLNWPYQGLY
ncbi:ciliary microtubule inner protein 1-like [Glandiceps talaboti]